MGSGSRHFCIQSQALSHRLKPGLHTPCPSLLYRIFSTALWLFLCFVLCNHPIEAAEPQPALRVLFLGDNGHHRPEERFNQLLPVLAGRQVKLNYTASLDDLNAAKLAGFDCVLIYANHTKISPEQETALLKFVSAGGGLAAI